MPSNSVIWVSEVRPGSLPLITAPIVVAQGFDLVWFGIIVIVVTEIALVTPPVGMNVFVLKTVLPYVPVVRMFKGLAPFIAVDVVRLALLVAFSFVPSMGCSTDCERAAKTLCKTIEDREQREMCEAIQVIKCGGGGR